MTRKPVDRFSGRECEQWDALFAAAFVKLREELGPHLGSGGGLVEILDGIETLRTDLREAVALLRVDPATLSITCDCGVCPGWFMRRDALLARHKEEP